ncbi:RecQ family ATP-dependent DNA helicase [Alkalibacter rhizosphaerae]|uniref:ATP-dependent DNA helicase RecQ n=1 Tax=Alkalibacter rhizosphaerae TaxID=2815577 RepID=A0A974XHF6_9FIRM|nr:RecQ family ATP-dependent DNA helicase [Alkalibacter rhizosphaerae]QSX08418.1 RecQ family ATP-dependent DNA helicase [Alkalibacter rhizosphaerae]
MEIHNMYTEKQLLEAGKRFFNLSAFREGQLPLIQAILYGNNVLGILPTGAGKSICFQLPALLSNDVSLVVSPLKSLMKDQVENLWDTGIKSADYLDSSKSNEEKVKILRKLKNGEINILYLSPERLHGRRFRAALSKAIYPRSLKYFIVDEAHCISEWGHDFRPAYLCLLKAADELGAKQRVAVTATASPIVQSDILRTLEISRDQVYHSLSLDRRELGLQVLMVPDSSPKERTLKQALEVLNKKYSNGSGLIFTVYAAPDGNLTAPLGTRFIQQYLQEQKIDSEIYHGKLSDKERLQVQNAFKKNQVSLLVATKGFGMGIDKPDIRYVIHMCYPGSLEAYYQEAGRAGRDREESVVLILARYRKSQCVQNSMEFQGMEPLCVNKWSCFYGNGEKCDYGMQAKFIYDSCPTPEILRQEITACFHELKTASDESRRVSILWHHDKSIRRQTLLYYFEKHGLVQEYELDRFEEQGQGFNILLHSSCWCEEMMESRLELVIQDMLKRKKQKYIALKQIQDYVENSNICRRERLLRYFEDKTEFGVDGCGFCDVDGLNDFSNIDFGTTRNDPMGSINKVEKRNWLSETDFWIVIALTAGIFLAALFF